MGGVASLLAVAAAVTAAVGAAILSFTGPSSDVGRRDGQLDAGIALSLVLIGVLTLVPMPFDPATWVRWNVVPFADFVRSLGRSPTAAAGEAAKLLANVALFMPLGFTAALGASRLTIARFTAAAVLVSVAVELTQFAEAMGREADITDVLTNGVGAAIGFAAARHFATGGYGE